MFYQKTRYMNVIIDGNMWFNYVFVFNIHEQLKLRNFYELPFSFFLDEKKIHKFCLSSRVKINICGLVSAILTCGKRNIQI